ncbi:hypothetical protein KUCAC02_002945 [Chaenocephalus aceratus]|uniref:Uncharacterized protein n=1 Tax=Chaenocephalus aceratus TaxID=36190 RepID=A0ACB9WKU6_CHAAC|nr:hypothetical protein KUCAC02_002945 [Chaenocephalus aceratus]
MSGQSITDRITAAQHSVTGSAISKTVCKATTHEVMGPKKKTFGFRSAADSTLRITDSPSPPGAFDGMTS